MPIGVFDSGLGGLTVLARLRTALPGQDFVYLGDNANAPYGTRGPDDIYRLTCAGVARLFAEGCGLVVLACNTASAVALRRLQQEWLPKTAPDNRVLGVFVPMIEVLAECPWAYAGPPRPARLSRVALFGTPATVASGAFPRELAFRARGLEVTQQPCPGLVEALESGDRSGAADLVRRHVRDLLTCSPLPEAAVLGCTHYPLVEEAFRAALPAGATILSQPGIVAASLADYLARHPRFAGGTGRLNSLTTGAPDRVAAGARLLLGAEAPFAAA